MAQQRGDDKAELPAVTVCVIAYNSGPTLRACLQRLGAQTFRDFEALVIDNDSPDPGDAAIAGEFPWVRLIRNDRTSATPAPATRAPGRAGAAGTCC